MVKQGSSAPAVRPDDSLRLRVGAGILAVFAAIALWVLGTRAAAMLARYNASRHIRAQEFSAAQRWLAWSVWLDPGDYRAELLKASCYRQLSRTVDWRKSLDRAVRKGAPQERVALETKLQRMRSSILRQGEAAEMARLCQAGASQSEVVTAFVLGHLAQADPMSARPLLERMPASLSSEAQREYLWGLFLRRQEDLAGAESRFTKALDAQPSHEPARAGLAELFEKRNELDRALHAYLEFRARSGGSATATVGLARVLRKLGRLEQSRAILTPLASGSEAELAVRVEMAQIATESGDFEEAQRRFDAMQLDPSTDSAILVAAAHTLTVRKRPLDAQRLFTSSVEAKRREEWIVELRLRLGGASEKAAAAAKELEQLIQTSSPQVLDSTGGAPQQAATGPTGRSAAPAAELYDAHCSACHGVEGDGRGVAARHLFPRPRDLRRGRCQLVSTRNGVPTLEDIQRVLTLGMPGTPMQSFQDLPEADRRLLALEVVRLRREGIRDEITRALREEGEEIDEAEVRHAVERSTTPAERVRVPAHWPNPGQAAAEGRARFAALGCVKCHGNDGIGAPDRRLFDEFGEPSRPRDLVHEPFKGGREPEAVYLRISTGMPGTADPAALNLPPEQLIELVDYIRLLARQPERMLTNYERRVLADGTSYREWLSHSSERGP